MTGGTYPGERTWSIAELAADFDVTHRTLRFYESLGLLAPERRGTRRIFHPQDRVRLALVLRGKRLGFDLTEIRQILEMYEGPPASLEQVDHLLERITARRTELEKRARDLEITLAGLDALEHRCRAVLERSTATAGEGALHTEDDTFDG